MQLLTWGTITGAIGSAVWLAALEEPLVDFNARALSDAVDLMREPPQAGPMPARAAPTGAAPAQNRPSSGSATSAATR